MKKIIHILLILCLLVTPVYAADSYYSDGRTERGPLARMAIVEYRGIVNLLGVPLEVVRSWTTEHKMHKWLWVFSYPPRTVTNIFTRAVSACYDITFMPWIMLFSNDMTPLTEPMGLPDYPWQMGTESY